MPIYPYLCAVHGEIEIWHSITEKPWRTHGCDAPDGTRRICRGPLKRLIAGTGGHVMEPSGIYRHVLGPPQIDPKTKRMKEEKITKAQFEREDRKLRDSMMDTRARAIKMGLTSEPR